jgi:hypothetical protein
MREQRRGRRIAMTPVEVDDFLATERTCRVATVDDEGRPHVVPLWFVWHRQELWLYSLTRSRRWADLQANPRAAVVVDAGTAYGELCGVEIEGATDVVGEVPRTGEPQPDLDAVEAAFAQRYHPELDGTLHHDGRHAWLRVVPDKISSWDFRKMGS